MSRVERRCPICGSDYGDILYTHKLDLPELLKFLPASLHIVCCGNCGMVYTSSEATQSTYNRYYDTLHAYSADKNTHTEEEDFYSLELREKEFGILKDHIDQSYNIIDIGTGTGGMLQTFQRHGFVNLVGIDIDDKEKMMKEKGLEFMRGDIQSLPSLRQWINKNASFRMRTENHNLFILNGVLEHILDVRTAMFSLSDTMTREDVLFIMVPDANEYLSHFDRPFRYFGMEHINHFNDQTLATLFKHYGFEVLVQDRFDYKLNPVSSEPALYALVRKIPVRKDTVGRENALAYIKKSATYEIETANVVAGLIDKGIPLIVWGIGSYFMSLCKKTKFLDANIKFFADNNFSLQGTKMQGINIIAPKDIADYPEYCVCVVSAAYSDNILKEIQQLGLTNEIIVL